MLLTLCIAAPGIGAALVLLLPARQHHGVRLVSLAAAATSLLLATIMVLEYDRSETGEDARRVFMTMRDDVLTEVSADPRHPRRLQLLKVLAAHPLPDDPRIEALAEQVTPRSRTDREVYYDALELALSADSPLASTVRYVEYRPWLEDLHIHYFVGVDGLSLTFLWLTSFAALCAVLYLWTGEDVKTRLALVLALVASTLATLAALDLMLLLASWQLSVLLAFLLVAASRDDPPEDGRTPGLRGLFTCQLGLLVAALVVLAFHHGPADVRSFNFLALTTLAGSPASLATELQVVAFCSLLISALFLLPLFPFHGWLPATLEEGSPVAGALVAGVTSKVAGYALLRLGWGLCPGALAFEWVPSMLASLGLFCMLYGTLCALRQTTLPRLVGFLSLTHVGFALFGVSAGTTSAFAGAALHLTAQGGIALLLLLLHGTLVRRGIRTLDDLRHMGGRRPTLRVLLLIGLLGLACAPGTAGFFSEIYVILGAWGSESAASAVARETFVPRWMCVVALAALVLMATCILPWAHAALRQLATRPLVTEERKRSTGSSATRPTARQTARRQRVEEEREAPVETVREDLDLRELLATAPIALCAIVLGVVPTLAFRLLDTAAGALDALLRG